MKRPSFSVVIAVHNGASTIGRAIESVLAQTYAPVETIVVDDGSSDGTAREVGRFGDSVHYIHQSHAGVSAARNAGVSGARGDWLAFLDADDWYFPDRLSWHAEWIREDPELDFLTGDFEYRDTEGNVIGRSMEATEVGRLLLDKAGRSERIVMGKEELGPFVEQHFGDTHTLSLPRQTFLELGGYPPGVRVCEDVHLLIRLCARSLRAGVICRPMAVYCVHTASATRSNPLEAQEQTVLALKPLKQDLVHAKPVILRGLKGRLRRARLDLATARLRSHQRMRALAAVMPLLFESPGWRSVRDCLSIVRGLEA